MSDPRRPRHGFTWWTVVVITVLLTYLASSGPVLATAFWLREKTRQNGFYAVMLLYYPLIVSGQAHPIGRAFHAYIGWWVNLFGTVGPG